jgi:hypothetical protein
MAQTNKTKAEILLELESLKGLLLEQDEIPILQEISEQDAYQEVLLHLEDYPDFHEASPSAAAQASLFDATGAHNSSESNYHQHNPATSARPQVKATGENPFLPQHIRERLKGSNPPPLFEYETAKKIISATKDVQNKINKPRQHLIDQVIYSIMPQVESELRHRLFAMSLEDLEELLKQNP